MSSFFDKLNLKPGERRLVIFVGIVVFIILNAVFVWPQFREWGKIQKRQRESTDLLKAFQDEIARTPKYKTQLEELKNAGAEVKSDYQSSKMQSTIYNQAALSGVQVNRYDAGSARQATSSKPNQFFEETTGMITVTTEEKSLIDFLFNLGNGGSLIRVRTMQLSPDPVRQRLMGTLHLVASYQKPAPTKAAPAGTSAKPAAAATAPAGARSAGSTNAAPKSGFAAARSNTNATAAAKTNLPPKSK